MRKALALLAVSGALAACPPQQCSSDSGTAKASYAIDLKSTPMRLGRKAAQVFTVYDLATCTDAKDWATCQKVPKLPVVVSTRRPGSKTVVEQAPQVGELEDNGDGTYSYYFQSPWFGPHVLGLSFAEPTGTHFAAFPVEVGRGGSSGFLCDTNGDSAPDVVHQVRWSASPGHISTMGGDEVTFSVELLRSFNVPLITGAPESNSFDPLGPTALTAPPTIKLMGGQLAAAREFATFTPVYKGGGIYEVKRAFAPADLGLATEATFWLDIRYTDLLGCAVKSVDSEADYYFKVFQSH